MVPTEHPEHTKHKNVDEPVTDQAQIRQLVRDEIAQAVSGSLDLPLQQLVASLGALDKRLQRLEQATLPDSDRAQKGDVDESRQLNDYAVQLFYMDQLAEAEQLLREAGKKWPKCVEVWNNLAVVYCALGQSKQAIQAFSHALDIDPKRVETLNNQGVLALLDAQPDKALEMLEEAHRRAPHQVDILANLAQANLSMGRHAQAIKVWKIIASLDPHHEEANQFLRQFYQ